MSVEPGSKFYPNLVLRFIELLSPSLFNWPSLQLCSQHLYCLSLLVHFASVYSYVMGVHLALILSDRVWGLFKNSDKSTSEIFQWEGLMWILGEEISLLLCSKSTIRRGKMNQKNKKDTGHYLKQNGHEKQTAKQVLCTIIDQKGEAEIWKTNIFQHRHIQSQEAF